MPEAKVVPHGDVARADRGEQLHEIGRAELGQPRIEAQHQEFIQPQ